MQVDKKLKGTATSIPGMVVLDLPVHGDNRGWFKENWQREKMIDVGLPDFGPVQNNISFNLNVGTTRGIHAEPWDKYVSIATGRVFGAWVDLREGASFGTVFTTELDPSKAVFVPRGVGNSFQTLEGNTTYSYLVNDHWSADLRADYSFLNLADESVAIRWPIPLTDAALSGEDLLHPRLADVVPMKARRTLILGGNGQLGRALVHVLPNARALNRGEFDITDAAAYETFDWGSYDTIVNAAAYTSVDGAETPGGRRACWAVNVSATVLMARVAARHRLTLVHISSDYVFDGSVELHTEDEAPSPLGVYGQSKAAADAIVATVPHHYIVRTSWVVGDGANFVRKMAELAQHDVRPTVVNDQFGRLSFTDDIAAGISHLLSVNAAPGIYNLSNGGAVLSWADTAKRVYELLGKDPSMVTGVTSGEYFANKSGSPRPAHSAFSLDKIRAVGFEPRTVDIALRSYLDIESSSPKLRIRSSSAP
jgi:dTDP-4-dehydrorhamnose reductase